MSDYLRDRFPLDATDTVRMSGEQGYNLVRYGKPGIIAYVELRPEYAETFREAVRDMEEAVRAEERERCAQIAENLYFGGGSTGSANRWGAKQAAARIREQGKEQGS